jgi:dienelactone hydrolase
MRRFASLVLLVTAALSSRALVAQDPPKDVTADAKAFVELLRQQEFAKIEALFTEQMKAALPEDKLKATWTTLAMQAGAFKQQRGARMEVVGNMRRVTVTCDFERAALDLVVAYNPAGLIGGFNIRPYAPPAPPWSAPAYADTAKFAETSYVTSAGDALNVWPLPGTLTVPLGTGPFPLVVLVHGSGPNDRDESIGPNKTFKDLAFGLASRGIAVYRYDKRSKVFGARMAAIPRLTVKDETIDDVLAAVANLRGGTPTIDPARIFVIGHSLGGMLIPRIAAADPRIAGFVSMAGATNELPATMARQTRYLVEASGRITPEGQKQIEAMEELVKTVAALTPADADDPKMIQGAPASYWLDLRGYDPPTAAKSITRPLLILQGERDYQVTMADDFVKWKAALDGKSNVTFHTYPVLNHLFMPGTGKSLPAEYEMPGHVPVEVINDIAAWIASIK